MTDIAQLVRLWMQTFEVPLHQPPTDDLLKLCKRLVLEESAEALDEFNLLMQGSDDPRPLAKELGDTIWVCLYAMWCLGFDPYMVMRRIYESNMSKLGANGRPILDAGGKIQKGPNYKEANLDFLIGD